MSDPAAPEILRGALAKLWSEEKDKPTAAILLVTPGQDHGSVLRAIADELGIAFISLRLGQVITPEQHMLFTQDKPRLIALLQIDRLSPSERDGLARLVYKGPRTLPVILCPVEQEKVAAIKQSWLDMRAFEQAQKDQAAEAERDAVSLARA